MPNFNFENAFSFIGNMVELLGEASFFSGIVKLILFIIGGIGIYFMSKNFDIKNPWICFVPFVQSFSLGRIARNYIKKDEKKSADLSIWLLVFNIVQYVISLIFMFLLAYSVFDIIANVENAVNTDAKVTIGMFTSFVWVIVSFFLLLCVSVIYKIFYYIALWRVFYIFSKANATVYTVLSVFFGFLSPIFLFILRNNNPAFDDDSDLGYFELEQV